MFLLLAALVFAPFRAQPEAMLQLFNLSWQEVADKIPEIAEAGYTSLWLPPPTKGGSGYSVGYDLWDPFDLGDKDQRGTVATRYGTKRELVQLSGKGKVYSWIRPVHPKPVGFSEPPIVALIDLEEGFRLVSNRRISSLSL